MPVFNTIPTIGHTDARLKGQSERAFGNNGELNASNKQDLVSQISKLLNDGTQNIVSETNTPAHVLQKASGVALSKAEKVSAVTASFANPNDHRDLGSQLATSINTHVERQGFARNLMTYLPLSQGEMPMVDVKSSEVVALIATSPSQYRMQLVKPNNGSEFIPEFDIIARPFIPRSVLNRNSDVLQSTYNEALEAIMVAEDRLWRQMAVSASASSDNTVTAVGGASTPLLGEMRGSLSGRGLTAQTMIIEASVWDSFYTDSNFSAGLDPFSQHQLLLTGQLGTYLGMDIRTDATRIENLRVLEKGDMFMVSSPDTHGVYSDRGGVEADPIDTTHEKVAGRGWVVVESLGMAISNLPSVAHARVK